MRWEYLIIKVHEDLEKREFAFNSLCSEQGWKLNTVDNGVAYFERCYEYDRSHNRYELTSGNTGLSEEAESKMIGYFGEARTRKWQSDRKND